MFLLSEILDQWSALGDRLDVSAQKLRYEELLRHGVQLADALYYMHNDAMPGKLVVHRDLKPDNIAFDEAGNLKLIDLGLGRVVPKSSDDNAVYNLTGQTGSLRRVGTGMFEEAAEDVA